MTALRPEQDRTRYPATLDAAVAALRVADAQVTLHRPAGARIGYAPVSGAVSRLLSRCETGRPCGRVLSIMRAGNMKVRF